MCLYLYRRSVSNVLATTPASINHAFFQAGKLQMTNDSGYSLKALYTLIWFLPSGDHLTQSRMMSTDSPIVRLIVLRNLVVVVFDLTIPPFHAIPIFPVLLYLPLCILETV